MLVAGYSFSSCTCTFTCSCSTAFIAALGKAVSCSFRCQPQAPGNSSNWCGESPPRLVARSSARGSSRVTSRRRISPSIQPRSHRCTACSGRRSPTGSRRAREKARKSSPCKPAGRAAPGGGRKLGVLFARRSRRNSLATRQAPTPHTHRLTSAGRHRPAGADRQRAGALHAEDAVS